MIRVLFFGMTGVFSVAPLEALIKADVDIGAVIIPAASATTESLPRRLELPAPSPSDLPVINPHLDHNIIHIAWDHGIPVWEVGRLSDPATLAKLAAYRPDLIVVACFSAIFPPALLQLPRHGCLNLHPSLLPAYRGPSPLFWMARQGERQAGVTLHFLDEGMDTGDIVAQTAFTWPEGISGADLERRCATEGAGLLVTAIQQLQQGDLPRRAQPAGGSSYFSWPGEPDFYIPIHWEARRAFNFLRSAADWPLAIEVGRRCFFIRVAISYDSDQTLEQPYILEGDELAVQFQSGVVKARIY